MVRFFISGNPLSEAIEPRVTPFYDPSTRFELGIGFVFFFLFVMWADVWDEAIVFDNFGFS